MPPRLSARWLWLISGVDYRLAQELVDGLKGDLLAQRRGFQTELISFDEAVKRALAEERVDSFKGLAGLGEIKFNFPRVPPSTVTTFVYVLGGGLDIRITHNVNIRAIDFEYQQWLINSAITLQPYGGSVGISYKIF